MIAAVDTNILLDILLPDDSFCRTSKKVLDAYNEKGRLVVCEIVVAELAGRFPSSQSWQDFLESSRILLLPTDRKALHLAGSLGGPIRRTPIGRPVRIAAGSFLNDNASFPTFSSALTRSSKPSPPDPGPGFLSRLLQGSSGRIGNGVRDKAR